MQNKILLQFFIFTVILSIIIFFYKVYFIDKKLELPKKNTSIKIDDQNKGDGNIIYNIEYSASDEKGGDYLIRANYGKLQDKLSSLIYLKEVTATINFENSAPIDIFSDNANYNSVSYDTEFYGNVIVNYIDHNITSDNLNLYFQKDLAEILNNVIYKNLNSTIEADKIEVDLFSKNSIIYMNNSLQKVKVTNKN